MSRIETSARGEFEGHRVLVLGATGDVGASLTSELLNSGAHVTLAGRDPEKLSQARAKLSSEVTGLLSFEQGNMEQIQDTVSAFLESNPVDHLVLLSGSLEVRPATFLRSELTAATLASNFLVPVAFAAAFAKSRPPSTNRPRTVVGVSSISANRAEPGLALYGATKAALERYLLTLSVETSRINLRVNLVRAGLMESTMGRKIEDTVGSASIDVHKSKYPLGTSTVQSIVGPILFLMSPRSSWVTGSVIAVDGGYGA